MKNNSEHNKYVNNNCYFSFKKSLVYLSIINKIKSGIINKCVRDRWRMSELDDDQCNNSNLHIIWWLINIKLLDLEL